MKGKRIFLAAIPVAAAVAGYTLLARSGCPPLKGADETRLADYVRQRYRLPPSAQLDVTELSRVGSTCYRRLEFKSRSGARKFQLALFASPDLRFLSRDLADSRADPGARPLPALHELRNAASGNLPALGPASAPVTLAVFSDFECPYCARFAGIMKEVLPAEGQHVRVVFRHFPLSMHPWARAAAEAAECGFQQKNEFFWDLHDFFFEHQRELTAENLRQKVFEHARGIAGLDRDKFEACVAKQGTKAAIDSELAFASASGIHGTPTVFANGKQTQVTSAEQLHSLIHQLTENPHAAIPSVELTPTRREPPKPREIPGLANGDAPALGPANAPVTLIVFSDFQCPYCALFAEMMRKEILPTEGGRVRVLYRYLPLDMHPWARAAAEAAACGYEQKNQFFWDLHDFFFAHQKDLTAGKLREGVLDHARGMKGLDYPRFETCLSQRRTKAAIDREAAFASQNGIEATPSVFLNGRPVEVVAPEQLRTLIRELGSKGPVATAAARPR